MQLSKVYQIPPALGDVPESPCSRHISSIFLSLQHLMCLSLLLLPG